MKFDERETELVQFSYELSLTGIGEVALSLYTATLERWEQTPKRRWLKRRKLLAVADVWLDLYRGAVAYEQEQSEAARKEKAKR